MQDLQTLEVFEIEVLELLNSVKLIDYLYFGGGTMLRLCHNLNRYSTDLDFWLKKSVDSKLIFKQLKLALSKNYSIIDSANKRNTLLFQFRKKGVTRSLKIEIRKEQTDFEWERKIAFSKFTTAQVKVQGLTLEQMMKNKISALLSRKLIRDAFDIQFLIMRGIELPANKAELENMKNIIQKFKVRDFKVTLGSLLDSKDREFYTVHRFKILEEEITAKLNEIALRS